MSIWTDQQGRLRVGIMVKGKRIHRRLPEGATKSDAKLVEAEMRKAASVKQISSDPPMPAVMDLYLAHALTLRSPETARFHALRCGAWCEGKMAFAEKFGDVSHMINLSAEEIIAGKVRLCNTSAVYLLFDGNELVYIGKSTNALSRIVEHAKKGRKFSHYYTLPVHDAFLDAVEQKMIDVFRPEQNLTHNSDHGLRSVPIGTPMAIKADWINQFVTAPPESKIPYLRRLRRVVRKKRGVA